MDKQDKILKILQEANKQADALTATQAKQLVDLLVSLTTKQVKELVNQFNQFSDSVSQETFKQIQNALIEIREKANTNQLEVRQLSNKNKKDFETAIARANDLIVELQSIEIPEPEEIDTEAIINETLSRIPEPVAETPSQVIEKINKSKKKIKRERVEGLDKVVDQDNLDRAISILDQRTQFLINKRSGGGRVDSVVAGTNITVDNTDPQNPVVSYTGGGGGTSDTAYAETPSGTINSSNVTFTLANTPNESLNVIVLLDGVTQYNGIDYTVSGQTITFVTAPVTGSTIFAYYRGSSVTPPAGDFYELEDGSGEYLMEDGTSKYLQE